MGFAVVDKSATRVQQCGIHAHLRVSSAAWMGSAARTETATGVGMLALADAKPEHRNAPAGHFVAQRGRNAHGDDGVGVDCNNAVSMHRVIAKVPASAA